MKRLATFLSISILIIFCLLFVGTAFLHFTNLSPYKKQIERIATNAIGRKIEINGSIDLNVFPHPEVILNDVSLANAAWGTQPAMATVKHLGASISFLSLFSKRITVKRVRLHDAVILLEKNKQQAGNWVIRENASFQKEKTGESSDKIVDLPLIVEYAEFRNLTATFRVPGHTDRIFMLSSLSLKPDASDNLILKSSGELLGRPVRLSGLITSKKSLYHHDAVNLDFRGGLGENSVKGSFSTSRLSTLAGLKGNLSIIVQDLGKELKSAGIETQFTGQLNADVTVGKEDSVYKAAAESRIEDIKTSLDISFSEDRITLLSEMTPLSRAAELFGIQDLKTETLKLEAEVKRSGPRIFEIVKCEAVTGKNSLTAKGSINRDKGADISIKLSSPDLSTVSGKLPRTDLTAAATAGYLSEKLTVSDIIVNSGKSDIKGNVTILSGGKPSISADIKSELIDLNPFSKTAPPDEKAEKTADDSHGKSADKKPAPGKRFVFKETPLNLALLEKTAADVTFSAQNIQYDNIELKNVMIVADARNGNVNAKFKFISAGEGHAAGKLDLEAKGNRATVETLVSLSDYKMNIFLTHGISPDELPPINVTLDLKTAGSSPRELASSANGRFLLTQGSGKINNNIIGVVTSDVIAQLVNTLNPFAKSEDFSSWDCAVVSVNISDGLADIDTLMSQGEKVLIVGDGNVDLKTEKLNVEFHTKPRSGVGITADMFVTPFIKLKGTLASPGIGLNKKGTLLTGGAAVATGGVSFFIKGLLDRSTAEGDHCIEALKKTEDHTRYTF